MGTSTIRPDGVYGTIGSPTIGGGAGSHNAATSDNSDGTYSRFPSSGGTQHVRYTMGALGALPTNSQIRSVTPRCRHNSNVGNGQYFGLSLLSVADQTDYIQNTGGSFSTQTGTARTVDPSGAAWTTTAINALDMIVTGPGTVQFDVAELYADVSYNEAPVATPVAIGIVATSRPSIGWTYTDPEGDTQERFRVKVFNLADASAVGFDPSTSTLAVADSGEVYSTASAWTCNVDLVNGSQYRAFIWVADTGSNGRYGIVSSATYSSITITLTPPATPTITATTDATNSRYQLVVSAKDNMLDTDNADFEGGIGTWTGTLNCSVAQSSTFASVGSFSMRMSSTAAGRMDAATPSGASGKAVLPSTQYSIFARARAGATGRTFVVYAFWYKADGSASSTPSATVATGTDVTGSFTQVGGQVTSPSDAAYAQVVVSIQNPAGAAELHYIDAVLLAPGVTSTWTPGVAGNRKFVVQRSDDGGTTWTTLVRTPVSGALSTNDLTTYTVSPTTQSVTVYDYEAPRGGTAPIYRAYSRATVGTNTVTSPNSATSTTTVLAMTGWWLKSLGDPSYSLKPNIHSEEWQIKSTERLGVFHALGRAGAIVVSDVVGGEEGALVLAFLDQASFDAFEALRNRREAMLLQSPYSDHMYVRFGADRASSHVLNSGGIPKRVVTIPFLEVDV